METIHLEAISTTMYWPIKNIQRRALVLTNSDYEVGDVMILNPFDHSSKRFMNYDALHQSFYPGSTREPLFANGIIVEITDVEHLDAVSNQQLVSFKPINHFLRKNVILAEAESQREKRLSPHM